MFHDMTHLYAFKDRMEYDQKKSLFINTDN